MGNLTLRRKAFVDEYLKDYNATRAAIRAGYSERSAAVTGSRLLRNANVLKTIQSNIMGPDEAALQITDIARGDMGDFLDISSMAFHVDLDKAKEARLTKLIQKVKMRTTTTINKDGVETETHDIEIALYDKLSALEKIGKLHKMFTEIIEHSGTVFVDFGEDVKKL
jgi:phage terminase small subunit